MDFDNLQDEEVQQIVQLLKHPKNQMNFDEAYNKLLTLFGKLKIDESIIDEHEDIEFMLNVYRGRIEESRFSLHLRFKEYHHHLVRIDIHPSNNHINPDNTKVIGSHIHIYSNEFEPRDSVAIPINESDFPLVENLLDAFHKFLEYNNIE